MFRIGLENNVEGRSQAWVLGHPGCYAYGRDGSSALQAVPGALRDYRQWIEAHTVQSWFPGDGDDFELEESLECYFINEDYELSQDGYEVNAWFRHDWKPLTEADIQRSLLLLEWGREELLNSVASLSPEVLDRTYPNERWSIAGILSHIGGAEWWYQDRLGLIFERSRVPAEPFARLEKVRSYLVEILPSLVDSTQVIGIDGEFWSPRKMVRRTVWHEYDHTAHIRKLL